MDEINNFDIKDNKHIEIGTKISPEVKKITKMEKRSLIIRTVIVTLGVVAILASILMFIFMR